MMVAWKYIQTFYTHLELWVIPIKDISFEDVSFVDIYVKVTLFEGSRVIKAKKTRPLSCAEVLHFNEKFSIRLPSSYLDSVSCVVSLCSR